MSTVASLRARAGFTLVELLAVVAVIAILLALLVPSLRGAQDRARTAACAAHLRQIGIGVQMYSGDRGGALPPWTIDMDYAMAVLGERTQFWYDKMLLGQYTGNARSFGLLDPDSLYVCPADTQLPPGHLTDQTLIYSSYGYNTRLVLETNRHWGISVTLEHYPAQLSRYANPSRTLFCIDGPWLNFHPGSGTNPPCYGVTEPFSGTWDSGSPTSMSNWTRRHNGKRGANMLFVDGHVEYTEDLKALSDQRRVIFTPTDG